MQKLITKQQTMQLTKTEEAKIVQEIKKYSNEIKKMKEERTKQLGENEKVKALLSQIDEEKVLARDFKKKAEEISNQISDISNDINKSLQELDEVRKKADEFHEQAIQFGKESEKNHEAFIQAKNDLRDLEKVINGLKTKKRVSKKKEKEDELHKKASVLFEKFKNGEELTTDDLLILQKAGFL